MNYKHAMQALGVAHVVCQLEQGDVLAELNSNRVDLFTLMHHLC